MLTKEINKTKQVLQQIPTLWFTLFVVSVFCMNILANKTIVQNDWIALDGGILISWLAFLCMDLITKKFGPQCSNRIAVVTIVINLGISLLFFIIGMIPSSSSDYETLNTILKGTWFIVLSSTIAFLVSAFLNNGLNWYLTNKSTGQNNFNNFVYSSFISTLLGQFVDNLIFALLVFRVFAPIYWDGFSWTLIQCIMCALTGCILEALMELIFMPLGYKIFKKESKGDLQ